MDIYQLKNSYNDTNFAVVNQPSSSGHLVQPYIANYTRGLEILTDLTTIVIREPAPFFSSCENKKIYEFLYQGEKLFSLDADGLAYCCYGKKRPFKLVLYDLQGVSLMSVFCTSIRSQNFVEVKAAGRIIGFIQIHMTWCKPKMSVQDADGVALFKIKRSICLPFCFWSEIDFIIYNMDGVEVGKITRHWSGACAPLCDAADSFSIKFPKVADIWSKALFIAACFLIDFSNFGLQGGSLVG